jgi:hypothetical protein
MAQLGHTDPTVTLCIYAQAMTSSDDDRERLRLLVEGDDLAVEDQKRDSSIPVIETPSAKVGRDSAPSPAIQVQKLR